MDSDKIPMREAVFLAAGEVIIGALICIGFLALGKYDYKVLTGVLLGVAVALFNFIFLCISVNRALDKCLGGADFSALSKEDKASSEENKAIEDKEENSDEEQKEDDEISRFAKENQAKLAGAIKISYIVRTFVMIAALVVAFITKQFNVIATLIPLVVSKPLLSLPSLIKRKER